MDKHDFILQQELLDEAPRFWLSRRWRLAVLGCFGFLIVTSNRIGVEVALLCMLNRTSTNIFTTHPLTARFPDQIGIVNPAWRIYSSLSVQQLGLSIASAPSNEISTEHPSLLNSRIDLIDRDFGYRFRMKRNFNEPKTTKRFSKHATTKSSPVPILEHKFSKLNLTVDGSTTTKSSTTTKFVSTSVKTTTKRKMMSTSSTKQHKQTSATTTNSLLSFKDEDYSNNETAIDKIIAYDNISFITTTIPFHNLSNMTYIDNNISQVNILSTNLNKCEFWNATTYSFLDTDLLSVPENGDLQWSRDEHTAIWESYYFGDIIVRIPSAFLAQRFGGKRIFALAVFIESICTALVPLASKLHYFPVLLLRLFTGMCAGFSTPAMYYMLGRWAPPDERCLLLAIINTGGWISGCAVVLPLSCLLCTYGFEGGWSSVFYVFGGFGMVWCILWMLFTADTPEVDSSIPHQEEEYIKTSIKVSETIDNKYEALRCTHTPWLAPLSTPAAVLIDHDSNNININNNSNKTSTNQNEQHLRWPLVLTSVQLLILSCTEFTHEWVIMTYFSMLPTYNNILLNFAIDEYSVAFIIPCAGFWFAMMMTAGAADRLHSYGVLPVTHVRKIMNSVGSVVSSCLLLSVMFIGCHQRRGLLYISILGLSFAGIQYSGALVAPLDLSSKYSAILVGISSIARASVRFIVPPFAALLLRQNQETGHVDDFVGHMILSRRYSNVTSTHGVYNRAQWYSLFVVTACCHLGTAIAYLLLGTAHHQSHWIVSQAKETTVQSSEQLTSDLAVNTNEHEKRNTTKVVNSRVVSTQHPASLPPLAQVQSSRVVPVVDVGYVRQASRPVSQPAKDDGVSETSFISTNSSFEENVDCSQRNDAMPRNHSVAEVMSSATNATVESNSANSFCSSPTTSMPAKSARDYRDNNKASFIFETSSDDRYPGYDDDDDDDDDDDEHSASSMRQLSRHLRNSLAIDSDLSESVV